MDVDNPYGEVISTYTDGDALEDGFLVPLNKRDRVTRALFDWLCSALPEGPKPPSNWPVEIMRWFGDKSPEMRAAALAGGLIGTFGRRAREVYDNNEDGGIWKAGVRLDSDGRLASLHPLPDIAGAPERWLWLLPNENGGLTLMLPEDY